ncbi:MAG TPA: exosortase/archaeosortase family protein [Candidatus Limnocylindrales bacterium]|nr:exosortase/archaeosortase family protein [Candidatus Limnocylindrales bacterium]
MTAPTRTWSELPWRSKLPGGRRLRAVALLVAVLIAYNYSLQTLARGITLQTPLGYLALVPIVALALAWIRLAREPAPIPIHDRQVDYILGAAFLAVAVGIAVVAPTTMGFWLNRLDLVGLPFFVAGLIVLLYGARRLWALKFPVIFLLLAWPLPYAPLVGEGMQAFADITASIVAAINQVVPLARVAPDDPTIFYVGQAPHAFAVSIGSACSGVNSLVGFIIVGGALAYAVRGSAVRRVAWLVAGLVIVWLLNILRIEMIFVAGRLFGQQAALDVLHPVAGLLTFNLGVLGMLLVTERVGLRFMPLSPSEHGALRAGSPVARVRAPLILVTGLALTLGVVNAGYSRFEAISNDLGQAKLHPFDIRQAELAGWSAQFVGSFAQGKQFFGESSTWDRILYSSSPTATLQASRPLYVDVINTDDPGTFAAFGLEACYKFHGYFIETSTDVQIGAGVQAKIFDYHNPKVGNDWSAIAWEWPYSARGVTAYERIVIFMSDGPHATFQGAENVVVASPQDRFADTDKFLVALATSLVQSHVQQSASATR